MGKVSNIEWTDHTFNPWIGCTKVSPGCAHCYAETLMDKRYGRVRWGKGNARLRTSAENWTQPERWNKAAAAAGLRRRVFCASLADVFDAEVDPEWRWDLFKLIEKCPALDWLLLTKRPKEAYDFIGGSSGAGIPDFGRHYPNIWLGVSVEDQDRAAERIPWLMRIPAAVRFLSIEPLLEAVDLLALKFRWSAPLGSKLGIDWVIVGGESGPGARPCHLDWIRGIVRQCSTACIPVFVKQLGADPRIDNTADMPAQPDDSDPADIAAFANGFANQSFRRADPKGGDPAEWPVDLRLREFPMLL